MYATRCCVRVEEKSIDPAVLGGTEHQLLLAAHQTNREPWGSAAASSEGQLIIVQILHFLLARGKEKTRGGGEREKVGLLCACAEHGCTTGATSTTKRHGAKGNSNWRSKSTPPHHSPPQWQHQRIPALPAWLGCVNKTLFVN